MFAVCAFGAESGTRTHTPVMARVFETLMSTNSIISAYKWEPRTRIFTEGHSLADCPFLYRWGSHPLFRASCMLFSTTRRFEAGLLGAST